MQTSKSWEWTLPHTSSVRIQSQNISSGWSPQEGKDLGVQYMFIHEEQCYAIFSAVLFFVCVYISMDSSSQCVYFLFLVFFFSARMFIFRIVLMSSDTPICYYRSCRAAAG